MNTHRKTTHTLHFDVNVKVMQLWWAFKQSEAQTTATRDRDDYNEVVAEFRNGKSHKIPSHEVAAAAAAAVATIATATSAESKFAPSRPA